MERGDAANRASSSAPGANNARGVLHQRGRMPYSTTTMAVGGFLIVAAIGYFTLYYKSKPGTRPSDVARATAGTGRDDTSNNPPAGSNRN